VSLWPCTRQPLHQCEGSAGAHCTACHGGALDHFSLCPMHQAAPALVNALQLAPSGLHAGDDAGPCLCGHCEFVRAKRVALNKAGVLP